MTLAELVIKISCDTSEAEKGINQTEEKTSKLGGVMGKVGSGIAKVGKVAGKAIAASTVAIGKFALDATKAYGQYEQLVGGVETLFGAGGKSLAEYQKKVGITNKSTEKQIKDSEKAYNNLLKAQNDVMKNAKQAYKTAGMDINSYMETVTAFSASLIKSLGNDTVAAAKAADQAVIDMSDNANKMGTDLQSIQNAYQGFAKQNFTMLDNLKLGYGGTRSEMQRLLKDAEEIQRKNGVNVKYSIKNLNDIYEAIHVIQTEMGITGTTADEASRTIQGSFAMMRASWMNLKLAIADPEGNVGEAITQLIDSAKTFANNAAPIFGQAIRGIGTAINELAPVISQELPGLIGDILPDLTQAAVSLASGLTKAIIENAPMIIDGFGQVFQAVGEEMKKSDNPVIKAAGHVVSFIGDLIRDPKGTLTKAWETVQKTAATIWEGIKGTAKAAWTTLSNWVNNNIIHPVAEWVEKKRKDITQAVEDMKRWLNDNIVKPVAEWIEKKRDDITNAVINMGVWLSQNIVQPVAEWIEKKRTDITQAVSDMGRWLNENIVKPVAEWIETHHDDIINAVTNMGQWLSENIVKPVAEWVEKKRSDITQAVSDMGRWLNDNIVKPVAEWTEKKRQDIKDAVTTLGDWVEENIVKPVVEFIPGTLKAVLDTIASIPRTIEVAVKYIQETFTPKTPYSNKDFGDNEPSYARDSSTAIGGGIAPKMAIKAKGDWTVPYDNYPALLHRNEMVLTASQARRYRDGENFDLSSLGTIIQQAIMTGMENANVNAYMDADLVTDVVNRRIGNELVSRRYSP